MAKDSFGLVIGGKEVAGQSTVPVIDPAKAAPFADAPVAGTDDLDLAVQAAADAFNTWSKRCWAERSSLLLAYADNIESGLPELAELLVLEQGKTRASAEGEVRSGLKFLRGFAGMELVDERIEDISGRKITVRKTPLGVVGAITPWNYPVLIPIWKIGPALITGNTVVLKPAQSTPLTSLWLGRASIGVLPDGVLNVVNGSDGIGPAITSHPGIRKISLTGSTDTGRRVMQAASSDLKRLTLELGGNDPGILMPDFDVETNAASLFSAAFANNGQVCVALKRLIVHESIHDRVVAALIGEAKKLRYGHGLDEGVTAGPVQNLQQFEKVGALIRNADSYGDVAYRATVPEGPGYFLPATIVTNVDRGSVLWRKEPFGPVLPIVTYRETAQAITIANDDAYGLGASVWGSDTEAAERLAAQLDAGSVWTNTHPAMGPNIPLAGIKQSGLGVEFGLEGLAEFTDTRVFNFAASGRAA